MQEEGGRPAERGRPPHLPLQFKIRGLFCRGARRDEVIPPYGRPGGCGCPVWPVVFGRFVGEGHGPPAGLAAARGPRDDASIVPYRGLRYRRRCGSPVGRRPCRFVGADSISARGCSRRRVFPVGLYVFPRPVGRAFTPTAPWRFQKSGPCAAAGSGGMRASRPTAVRVVAASRLAAGPPLVVGEGFIPPADTCGSARSPGRCPPLVVGEGFIPPADTCGGAGPPGRCEHRPLQKFAACAAGLSSPGWPAY